MDGEHYLHLNGALVGRSEAMVSALDRGFLYGDGFFETTRVIGGKALFLERHLERLAGSCSAAGFGTALDLRGIAEGVVEVVRANAVAEGYLRISVSRGMHEGRLTELVARRPTVLIQAEPMDLPSLAAPQAITLSRSPYRINEHSPVVRHKSMSYQGNLLALAEAQRQGADEAYFLNGAGHLTEGAISNLFFVRDGRVCTPDISCGLLPGVMRQVVLEICSMVGLPAQVGRFGELDLLDADEVFCTNSLRGIVGVEQLLEWPDKDLQSHLVTHRLQVAYDGLAREYCAGE